MSGDILFNPLNPRDYTKKPDTRGLGTDNEKIGVRFTHMREDITLHKSSINEGTSEIASGAHAAQEGDAFLHKWEQMICQICNNSKELFTPLNNKLIIESNCIWVKTPSGYGYWEPISNQCADIQLIMARNEDGDFHRNYEVRT